MKTKQEKIDFIKAEIDKLQQGGAYYDSFVRKILPLARKQRAIKYARKYGNSLEWQRPPIGLNLCNMFTQPILAHFQSDTYNKQLRELLSNKKEIFRHIELPTQPTDNKCCFQAQSLHDLINKK